MGNCGGLQMLNKVTKKECMDAIEYMCSFALDEMTTDKKYYTTILMKKVANSYKIKLVFDNDE